MNDNEAISRTSRQTTTKKVIGAPMKMAGGEKSEKEDGEEREKDGVDN